MTEICNAIGNPNSVNILSSVGHCSAHSFLALTLNKYRIQALNVEKMSNELKYIANGVSFESYTKMISELSLYNYRVERFGKRVANTFKKIEDITSSVKHNNINSYIQLNTADNTKVAQDGAVLFKEPNFYLALLMLNADSSGINKAKASKYLGKPVARLLESIYMPRGTKLEFYSSNVTSYFGENASKNTWGNIVISIRMGAFKKFLEMSPKPIRKEIIKNIRTTYPKEIADRMISLGEITQKNRAIATNEKARKNKTLASARVKFGHDWQHDKNARIRIGLAIRDLLDAARVGTAQQSDTVGMKSAEVMFKHSAVGFIYDLCIDGFKKIPVLDGSNYYIQARSVPVNIISNRLTQTKTGGHEFEFLIGAETGDFNEVIKKGMEQKQLDADKRYKANYILNRSDASPKLRKKALADLERLTLSDKELKSKQDIKELNRLKHIIKSKKYNIKEVKKALKDIVKFAKASRLEKISMLVGGGVKALVPGHSALGISFTFKPDASKVLLNEAGQRIYIIYVDGKNVALPAEMTPTIDRFTFQEHLPEAHPPVKKPDMSLDEFFSEQVIKKSMHSEQQGLNMLCQAAKAGLEISEIINANDIRASLEMEAYKAARDVEYKKLLNSGYSYDEIQQKLTDDYSDEVDYLLPDILKNKPSISSWNNFISDLIENAKILNIYEAGQH